MIGGNGGAFTQYRRDGSAWSGWRYMGGYGLVGGLRAIVDSGGTYRVFGVNNVGALYQYIGNYDGGWAIQNVSNGGLLRGTRPSCTAMADSTPSASDMTGPSGSETYISPAPRG